MRRNEIVRSLVSRDIYTGGTVAANLLTLEMQRSKLTGDIAEDTIELNQMSERKQQVENLVSREEGRLGKTGAAEVIAEHHGQIVSVDASFGDFVMQGQPVAKSLDCNDAFAAAVYRSRDVASLEIGMPAMVNFRSLGVKRSGHIHKIVRYFNSGPENRYFAKFPEAEGHEVYVLIKMDEPAADEGGASQRSDDKFFGCHVGEDAIVSLGETMISRVTRYSKLAVATLFSSSSGSPLRRCSTKPFARVLRTPRPLLSNTHADLKFVLRGTMKRVEWWIPCWPILAIALVGAAFFPFAHPALADETARKQLACSLCDGLAAQMNGEPGQPFVLRSFEPANGGSALHPALENTGFTYDNAVALMALYGCQRKAEARRIADALVLALETDRHDGRLRNAYRSGPVIPGKEGMLLPGYWNATSNSWIEDGYQVGTATGSTAWGALALLMAYEETDQPAYLDAARKIMAGFIETPLIPEM
ncbi:MULTISPECIES: hypothetical protein [unclassified Rhizobium]|uniref:hypothetical protein n=1 Tax=unclassified Rhizobium TaxID=2613769 RepID=UPI001FD9B5FE|nr:MULTISPECIES: hypothetical protein [unclassified Rhizobium]